MGPVASILTDWTSSLLPPKFPGPEIPKIVLVSGRNRNFGFPSEENKADLHRDFTLPLRNLTMVLEVNTSRPDFLVLTMPSAVLHEELIGEYMKAVLAILEQGYSVHMKKISVNDHNIPQNRTVMLLVAAPPCTGPQWNEPLLSSDPTRQTLKVRDVISDISFRNPRADGGATKGFVCGHNHPVPRSPVSEAGHHRNLYNHQIGCKTEATTPIDLDTRSLKLNAWNSCPLQRPVTIPFNLSTRP